MGQNSLPNSSRHFPKLRSLVPDTFRCGARRPSPSHRGYLPVPPRIWARSVTVARIAVLCTSFQRPAVTAIVRNASTFRALLQQSELCEQIPAAVWQQDWNVNCQAVPNAEASISYLAPSVFKVTSADQRILDVQGGQVSFSYWKAGAIALEPGFSMPWNSSGDSCSMCYPPVL